MNRRMTIHVPSTFGERAADSVAIIVGGWGFVFSQLAIIGLWIIGNSVGTWPHPDGWPFIALNLLLSAEAAFATSILLISSNRAANRDRLRDDLEAEEIAELHAINKTQLAILERLDDLATAQGTKEREV